LAEIRHRIYPESTEARVVFTQKRDRECARYYSAQGLELSHRCFRRPKKREVMEENLSRGGLLEFSRRITIDEKSRPVSIANFTRHGEYTGRETFTTKIQGNLLHNIYRKTQPLGAISHHSETVLDEKGRQVAFKEFYADGSPKASTSYKWNGRYKATGTAMTIEGVTMTLELTTDKYRHRLLEKKFMGGQLKEEERSEYDPVGRLISRSKRDHTGKILHKESIIYNGRGLVSEKRLYRGNIHQLTCYDSATRATVTSPLPARERATITYDALGRVIELKRFYLDQELDQETITYTPKGNIAERAVWFPKTKTREKTVFSYDPQGRLLRRAFFQNDQAGEIIEYTYNPKGLPIKRVILKGDGKSPTVKELPDGSIVNFTYDKRGRVVDEAWFHADGTPALTTKSEGCVACRTDKKKAVAHITWSYTPNNLLKELSEYGLKKDLLYQERYTYSPKGRVVSLVKSWPREKKSQELTTTYSPKGSIASTTMRVVEKGAEVFKEERLFDGPLLLDVATYKKSKLVRRVTRKFAHGLLARRTVTKDNKTVIVTLTRNPAGLVIEEKAVDDKGKPALAKDYWNNRYTASLAQYSDNGLLQKLIYTDELGKTRTESRFIYDKESRQTQRNVLKNGSPALEIREFFKDPKLAAYGIFSSQMRTAFSGKERRISSYEISVDTTNIENSSAQVRLQGKAPIP
ncbi:hypothetical protein KJ865_04470, partial [Myxococcota bacterium]|nr:hypothetical protein [Myxococcota bacterium]